MSSPVELIKERLSIADVVGSYLTLERSGANLKAKCPFHNERTPSFFVSPARGSYYCFGCSAKGDIFSFVQAFEGLDFVGALKTLATRAGVELVPEDPRVKSERERLFSLMETATLFYQREFEKSVPAREYLLKRGLTEASIASWRVGYAIDSWHACSEFCKGKGFTEGELAKAGITKTDNGKTYDRFRNRVMFPIFDGAGRVLAFSGRLLGKDSEHAPKYLNSPETPIFSKSHVLYGFDRAKNEIRRLDYAMLVEGQMDLLMSHQAGFKNAVASSGTAFTEEQLSLLKRLSKRILMVYDADKAGIQASLRSASLALASGMEVKVAALPTGSDPAELILKDIGKFKECLRSSTHIIDFYLKAIMREKTDERTLARTIRERLLPYVAVIDSSVERDRFIRSIALETGVAEKALHEDVKKISSAIQKGVPGTKQESTLNPQRDLPKRLVAGIVLWQRRAEKPSIDVSAFEKEIGRILGAGDCTRLIEEAKKYEDELIYQAESYYGGHESLDVPVRDLLLGLEEDVINTELARSMKELVEAERTKDASARQKMLARHQELAERRNVLKKERSS